MDFALTAEQEQIRAMAGRVAREFVAPRAAESDREGRYPFDYFERSATPACSGWRCRSNMAVAARAHSAGDRDRGSLEVRQRADCCC
jgi:alkylation response protein AidB-like acyl-CoA dehydrogenase